MNLNKIYDVIVVGAGHAGLEACFAAAKSNLYTCLITLKKKSIGLMPCNPSIGGPAKGIVTREIDALGGMQAKAADACAMQMKILNSSKGPGVWAIRSQTDKVAYHEWFVKAVEQQANLDLYEAEVTDLLVEDDQIKGVVVNGNEQLHASVVILTTGTYLQSVTHKGSLKINEGPDGLNNAQSLSHALKKLGFELIRLKTGTPPRIKKDSINYENMIYEPGTNDLIAFSHYQPVYKPFEEQLPCYIIHTSQELHELINAHLKDSAMYGGMIDGVGPRYCPSIEDKIVKFANKPRHQIFVEPESYSLDSIYLGGFSTSMPIDVQEKMIRMLPGLEKCEILKYAYAIEYDAIDPTQLYPTLESKKIKNLYFAGQINGTSGYEEAAAQGLMAAINAILKLQNKAPLILKRTEAYIGVMIDDIVTKGIVEPYRLLTSRAEHRLSLRNDNADDRLIKYGYDIGLVSQAMYDDYVQAQKTFSAVINWLKNTTIGQIDQLKNTTTKTNVSLFDYLKRPEIKLADLLVYQNIFDDLSTQLISKIQIAVKYEGYIKNQEEHLRQLQSLDTYKLDPTIDYHQIPNISLETRDKLAKIRPLDLQQASRISGVNLVDIAMIKYYLEHKKDE
ncbi:tRNA uridine-5-carboxymethylaminomethyl(34) synthesis enzyme MnmG [Ureaplasma miroungigenitalium]|uniref:tRNA uridine-5-carboxymethylaminomethyl(34) synthesis enzyme MnmG n=1 Tax=Ureaplasma miroungigenitalium TaxID=1042321 RepID=UPI0021E7E1B4|nr:tRNA uridine-5-carboxymethylaminomethyl(34) synthesis enzyme MnmG [Ureaplasma miroungigenitalium]MCV3734500.1 tRNA uridine-5-carboxymethylaminomethyl(34) synthesis enzyme MnmG [Ureaplasma miroungigenitalium]